MRMIPTERGAEGRRVDRGTLSLSHRVDRIVERIARTGRGRSAVEDALVIRHETGQRVRRPAVGRRAHRTHAADVRQQFVVFQIRTPFRWPHLFHSRFKKK